MYIGLESQVLPTKYALCFRFLYFGIGTKLAVGQQGRYVSIKNVHKCIALSYKAYIIHSKIKHSPKFEYNSH